MKTFKVLGGVPSCNNCEVSTKRCKGIGRNKSIFVEDNGCKHHSGSTIRRDTRVQDIHNLREQSI